jgi:hypothetical protein
MPASEAEHFIRCPAGSTAAILLKCSSTMDHRHTRRRIRTNEAGARRSVRDMAATTKIPNADEE